MTIKWSVADISLPHTSDACIRVRLTAHQPETDFEGWAATHTIDVLVPSTLRDIDAISAEALRRAPIVVDLLRRTLHRPMDSGFTLDRDSLDAGRLG